MESLIAESTPLSLIQRQIVEKIPFMPFAELMGFEMVRADFGEIEIDFEAQARHHNPMGTLNGGALAALTDAAMGMTMVSILKPDESFTTLEQKTNFLKPIWTGKLRASGRVIKDGNTVVLVESKVTDAKGSLVAYAASTCMKLRGERTKNREVRTTH